VKRLIASAAVALTVVFAPIATHGGSLHLSNTVEQTQTDYLPKVALVDQNGRTVSLASLRGKPVLLGFMHTDCKGPCEMMTARMKMVARSLGPRFDSKVTLVSITTDPDHDGVKQLVAYAKEQGANQQGWLFLTGQPAHVRRILALYNVPHESEEDEMTHVFDLYLVAPDGRHMQQYHGTAVPPQVVAADISHSRSLR